MKLFATLFRKRLLNRQVLTLAAVGLVSFLSVYIWMNGLTLGELFNDHCEEITLSDQELKQAESASGSDFGIPVLAVPSKGYHIHINLDEKQLYVYKDGFLITTYLVSGGQSSTPSPTGTWKIIAKDDWGEGFGGTWLGLNVPWGKYGIHGTIYPGAVGKYNTSKGCIRMKNKDAKELAKTVPYGTTVTIISYNRAFRTLKSGDIGSDVRDIQQALSKLGYYKGYSDGRFGPYLQSCIIKFQKDNKLNASGVINKSTYNLINQKAAEIIKPDSTR